jgi:uncharacterized protein YcbK (DUF882 family)
MRLSENFYLNEFECKSGVVMPEKVLSNIKTLAIQLQVLRNALNASITVTSGYRSPEHNKKVGGSPKSQHVEGTAADIKVSGYTPKQVAAKIEELIEKGEMKQGGIGIYSTWVHYDFRGTKARW